MRGRGYVGKVSDGGRSKDAWLRWERGVVSDTRGHEAYVWA